MLVSAVLDPSAFEADCFDDLYTIHAEDFLKGIKRNGLLIIDSDRRLQNSFVKQVKSDPNKYGQRLPILVAELLKNRKRRVVECRVLPNSISSRSLLDLAYHLKTVSKADALIVESEGIKKLNAEQKYGTDIVPLSEYRDSDFERDRQWYENQFGPIDTLSKPDVEDIIIRSVRFSKWLRFYDKQIGTGNNTSNFQRGIAYILSLWKKFGFFASQPGIGSVEIFTCRDEYISDDDIDDVNRKINRELMERLKDERFPHWWQIKLFVKDDPDGIFHARYLETQHAIIRIDRGFDLFNQNNEFRRNFFTLNMAESSHLRECRELPDADLG